MNLNEIMTTSVSPFEYTAFGTLESVDVNGEFFFPASASAKVLGYHNPRKAIIDHCDSPVKLSVPHPQNKDKTIVMNYISEADLYSLIFGSKLPAAKEFRRLVTKEILPSIRKYGAYFPQKFIDECDGNPDELHRRLGQIKPCRVAQYFTENPERQKQFSDENIIDVGGSEAS